MIKKSFSFSFSFEDFKAAEKIAKTLTVNIEAVSKNYDIVLFGNDCIQFDPNEKRLSEQPLGHFVSTESFDFNQFKKINLNDLLSDYSECSDSFRVDNNNVFASI